MGGIDGADKVGGWGPSAGEQGSKDGCQYPGWHRDPVRAFGGAMTPEDIPACVAGTCLTAVPFQAHLSSPTLCSIKLNFPSIFNGLLIDEDWAIAFRLHARGVKRRASHTVCKFTI